MNEIALQKFITICLVRKKNTKNYTIYCSAHYLNKTGNVHINVTLRYDHITNGAVEKQ